MVWTEGAGVTPAAPRAAVRIPVRTPARVDLLRHARSLAKDSRGKAGARPALPRNCKARFYFAQPGYLANRRSRKYLRGRGRLQESSDVSESGRRSSTRPRPVAPGPFNPQASGPATVESLEDAQNKSQYAAADARSRSGRARSHATSFAVSIAAHACAFAALIYFAPALSKPNSDRVLAYLVEIGDGSSGGSGSVHAGAATTRSIPIRSEAGPLLIPSRPTPHKTVHRSLATSPHEHEAESSDSKLASLAPSRSTKSAPGADSGSHSSAETETNGSSTNTGDGSGSGRGSSTGSGDGSSIAHADYGSNPPPIYPAIARRRDQQGTVTIRALIGADGSVERAEIAESSGFDSLDDSALDTVRRRWRFVPARRDNVPVESWVLVPIRFALTEARASR